MKIDIIKVDDISSGKPNSIKKILSDSTGFSKARVSNCPLFDAVSMD